LQLKRIENAPLADRARTAILDAILKDQFPAGRLPPEDVLAEMLNVSRTTIRTALHSLEQEGVVSRRRAVGTTINGHVRPSALALQRLVGFDALLEEKGYDVRVESFWKRAAAPLDLVELSDDLGDEDVLLTEKRYHADGKLAIYIRDAVRWSELKAPESIEESIPPSMFEFSRQAFHRPIDHAVVEMVAVVKRAGTTKLKIPKGEAFTRLHERHYTSGGELLAASVIDVDDAFVRFEVVRRQ
jgi:GntR family transcriptional regulator